MANNSEQNTNSNDDTKNVSDNKILESKSAKADLLSDDKTTLAVKDIEKQDSDKLLDDENDQKYNPRQRSWIKRIFNNKKLLIPIIIAIVVITVFALPMTRYKVLGLVLKQDFKLEMIDNQTSKPISDATINLDGQTAMTNNHGQATLHVKVGSGIITISKKYYVDSSQKVTVGISSGPMHTYKMIATGRQVPLTVLNKINDQPVPNVVIKAAGTNAETDQKGKVTIVLPANKATVSAQLSATDYNPATATIHVTTAAVPANTFKIVPSGNVYFLSNASGNIDVVNTNLDGSNRKTVLAGTGNEDPNNTALLASRDWKYLALRANRTSSPSAELYLISTSNNTLSTMNSTVGTFAPIGWVGHDFIYEVVKTNVNSWQNGREVLESYNADSKTTTQLDQTTSSGSNDDNYTGQEFGYNDTYITNGQIIYEKDWEQGVAAGTDSLSGKQNQIIIINPNGSGKQIVKNFPVPKSGYFFIDSLNYNPNHIYYRVTNSSGDTYYDYSNGSITQTNTITDTLYNNYSQNYSIFLQSPSGNQTFWSEQRDGKNSLFIGDANGGSAKQIAPLSDYTPYGWYSDKYLLVEKNGNEIYDMSLDGKTVTKISDYYEPPQNIYGGGGGGGGGYGGL